MKTILIIVRSEGDFERAISIGLAGKTNFNITYLFVGDFSPFYKDGINNNFQKKLFEQNNFIMHDLADFDFISRILKALSGGKISSFKSSTRNIKSLVNLLFFILYQQYISKSKNRIVNKVYKTIKPDFLFTDQSMTEKVYLPEIIRVKATDRKIPVYIFTHGAAGGLHSEFSNPIFNPYNNYTVFACNENETDPIFKNRIIIGDMSSSYTYVHYLNRLKIDEVNFLNKRKHRVAFYIGGVMQAYTSTNGWSIQEEIIIDLSEREDVAMILKLHPREAKFMDLRMLKRFKNLKILSMETDRSRVTKWANIVVCNDHTSVIFEPMILGKKVVAIEGKHIPKYKNNHSPLKNSSVKFISNSSQFDLYELPNADPLDSVTDEIAWGGNGSIDLAELLFKRIESDNKPKN